MLDLFLKYFRNHYLKSCFLSTVMLIFTSNANSASTEYFYLHKVLNDSAIVIRGSGEIFNIEYGVGCISIAQFEGRRVLVSSPGMTLGIGSQLILLEADQRCKIWSSDSLGFTDEPQSKASRAETACQDGHWIQSVGANGEIIQLEDGSIWQVDGSEVYISSLWLPVTRVSICGTKLINTDDGESVGVNRLK